MKIRNSFYLAFLNIKRNLNRTIRTIIGLVVGISLITLSIFFTMSFRYGLLGYLEENRLFNSFNYRYGGAISKANNGLNEDDIEKLKSYDGITSTISYKLFGCLSYKDKYCELIVDNITYDSFTTLTGSAVDKIDENEVNQYSLEYCNEKFIKAGTSTINQGEILLSSNILNRINKTADEIIGKTISIKAPYSDTIYYYDENNNECSYVINNEMKYLIKDFKVVGVYNYFKKRNKNNTISISSGNNKNNNFEDERILPYSVDCIVSDDAIQKCNYTIIKEERIISDYIINYENKYVLDKSPVYYEEDALANHKIFNLKNLDYYSYLRVFFKNYDYSSRAYEDIYSNYLDPEKIIYEIENSGIMAYTKNLDIAINEDFVEFSIYHRVISNISLFLLIISVIILFISIINVFNIIGYNVHKNEANIGFMKAIGLKNKDINKIYLFEFIIYLIISIIISFIITLSLSIVGTNIINTNFKTTRSFAQFTSTNTINIGYYFLSFAIVIIILGIISYIYTLIVTRKVEKSDITYLLKK